MSIPVYLFTGFLDAGKTAFIQETLEDPGFNTGEKTLVLLCEEGENEYRPERFAGGNVSFLPVEEQAGLTTAFLKDYQKKHRVDRVLTSCCIRTTSTVRKPLTCLRKKIRRDKRWIR